MNLRMEQLRLKEVIDIGTGDRYGFVSDMELDTQSGTVNSIVIYGRLRLWGLLGREDDTVVPWTAVRQIGEDIVLVDGGQISTDEHRRVRKRG